MPRPLAPTTGNAHKQFKQAIQQYLAQFWRSLHSLARTYGLCLSLISAAIVGTLSYMHGMQWLDSVLLRTVLNSTPSYVGQPQVLLLETPFAQSVSSHAQWRPQIEGWLAQGARRVVISFVLPKEQLATLTDLQAQGKVVFANASDDAPSNRPAFWQASAGKTGQFNMEQWPNYRFAAAALPVLSLQRTQQEGILPSLIKNKVVLVGYAEDAALRSYPWPGSAQGVSQLKLDALQVDTLLQHSEIQRGSWEQRMLIASAIAAALFLLWQRSAFQLGAISLLVSLLLSSVISALVLAKAQYFLPLAEIWASLVATFASVFYAKMQADDKKLRQLISTTSGKLHKLALPPTIFQTADHWQFILSLIDQTLHVNRVILLEKVANSYHLREVQALHHAPQNSQREQTIREMRRDYRRTPYSTALKTRSLCQVDNFLGSAEEGEEQYVMPLLLNGELMGFLAIGVAAEQSSYFAGQKPALEPIAQQVAKLLYQRQLWIAQSQKTPHWQRWLQDRNSVAFNKLTQAVGLMEQRLALVEHTFTQSNHAAVVYDLFGRVLLVNNAMQQRMAHSTIKLQNLNATHFLANLSGQDIVTVRQAMQQLILQHQSFSWPVSLPEMADEHLMLRVSVLENGALPNNISGSAFDLEGIMVEVMDVSEMMLRLDASAEIRQQAAHYLHEDLQKLPAMLRAVGNDKLSPDIFKRLVAALEAKADSIAAITQKSRLLLEDQSTGLHACYPLDVAALMQKTAADSLLATQLAKKNVQLQYAFTTQAVHGFAQPKELKFCLQAIVQLLLVDAASDSLIQVSSSEESAADTTYLLIDFSNAGYGISDLRLQFSLSDATFRAQAPHYAQAYEAMTIVATWGGSLSFNSAIGAGTQAHLRLCGFNWHSPASDELLLAQIANARAKAAEASNSFPRPRLVK